MGTANDLNISQSGIVTFDGTATFSGRTLQAGTGISITNGNGVSGNPIINATGSVTTNGFFVYLTNTISNVTGDGTVYTVVFDTVVTNPGGGYSTLTGLYTAPTTGLYSFSSTIFYNGIDTTGWTDVISSFTGSVYSYRATQFSNLTTGTAATPVCLTTSAILFMTAGDTMGSSMAAFGGPKVIGPAGGALSSSLAVSSIFSGFLVH
jgi:hypothetical protein